MLDSYHTQHTLSQHTQHTTRSLTSYNTVLRGTLCDACRGMHSQQSFARVHIALCILSILYTLSSQLGNSNGEKPEKGWGWELRIEPASSPIPSAVASTRVLTIRPPTMSLIKIMCTKNNRRSQYFVFLLTSKTLRKDRIIIKMGDKNNNNKNRLHVVIMCSM